MLSDKWVCLVLCALMRGPARHSEIARQIAGVSQKMLTQTLRSLEADGFITRTVTAEVPVRVDYELTALGLDFAPVMVAIKTWAEAHMDDVLAVAARKPARTGVFAVEDDRGDEHAGEDEGTDDVAHGHDEVVDAGFRWVSSWVT